MLTEKSFDTGELIINYAERPASGLALVLLHGGTQRWQDWDTLIARFDPSWHIYACDLRGHGKSGRAGDHYLLTDFVRDISAFLRQVVVEPAIVIGHSLGAIVALGTAAAVPDQVRRLVVLDPPLFLHDSSITLLPTVKYWFDFVYQVTSGASSLHQVVETIRPYAQGADDAELQRRAEIIHGNDPRMIDMMRTDKAVQGFDMTDILSRITSPTLIICGEWDKGGAVRPEDIIYAKQHLRSVEIVQIPGADHQLTEETHLATVMTHLTTFFQSVGIH